MSFLTGKTKSTSVQKSESGNNAFGYLKDTYSPMAAQGGQASTMLSQLLGLGGDEAAADAAYGRFQDSTGYETVYNDGQRALTGSAAGRQVLQSGAAAKALQARGQETAKSFFPQYVQMLLGLGGQGLQAGNLIGGAGAYSNSTGESKSVSKPGLGPMIGSFLGAAASDPRLKTDIDMIGTAENGLGIYKFRYIWDDVGTVHIGYMADEVAELAPYALGPELPGGYMTVDYSKLPKIGG